MPKTFRTYQPSKRTRKQQFGFRARTKTANGPRHPAPPPSCRTQTPPAKGVEIHFKRHTQQHT